MWFKQRIFTFLAVFVLTGFGFYSISWARSTPAMFVEHGQTELAKGNIYEAIDDFSRALLLDPANTNAKNGLIQIQSYPGLTGEEIFNLYHFEDLSNQMGQLEQKMNYLLEKCNLLARDLNMEQPVFPSAPQVKNEITFDETTNPLEIVNITLQNEVLNLESQLTNLQTQYDRLRKVSQSQDSDIAQIMQAEMIQSAPQSIISRTEDDHSSAEFVTISEQKDDTLRKLHGKVVDYSLSLLEREALLKKQYDQITKIKEDYTDLEARFELGQRLIDEKQKEITRLKTLPNNNGSLRSETAKTDHSENLQTMVKVLEEKDLALYELNGILNIYRQSLADTKLQFNNQSVQLFRLAKEVDLLKAKSKKIAKHDAAIQQMRLTIQDNHLMEIQQIAKLQNMLNDKDVQLREMKGILDIYRAELADAKNYVHERMGGLSHIEEEVQMLQAQLYEKEEVIEKTRQSFFEFESQLLDMQHIITALKENPAESQSVSPKLEAILKRLQSKLDALHDFLKNEVGLTQIPSAL